MKLKLKHLEFFGIFAIVTAIFGFVVNYLLAYDRYHLAFVHWLLSGFFIAIFLFGGGIQYFRSLSHNKRVLVSLNEGFYLLTFVGILVIVNVWFARNEPIVFDSTEQKAYTLSVESQNVLDKLPQKI